MDSRPGQPLVGIEFGGCYAQPSLTFDATYLANEFDRITSYLGNRNCSAPVSSDEMIRQYAQAAKPKDHEKAQLAMQTAYHELNIRVA